MIAGIAALSLILLIMMFITRSLVAALVIVGTVALSLGASFGLSVLVWEKLLGIDLYWIVLALAVILLLAVGSDYNLLLISRFKEEIHAGLNTGIIRSMASTGAVVTAAGLVFAATMGSFVFSNLRVLGQIGTTIGLGLLFDTLVVRSFMTPALAALLGRWFWWPMKVRPRPASAMLRPYGTRPSVRELLHEDDDTEIRLRQCRPTSFKFTRPKCGGGLAPVGIFRLVEGDPMSLTTDVAATFPPTTPPAGDSCPGPTPRWNHDRAAAPMAKEWERFAKVTPARPTTPRGRSRPCRWV